MARIRDRKRFILGGILAGWLLGTPLLYLMVMLVLLFAGSLTQAQQTLIGLTWLGYSVACLILFAIVVALAVYYFLNYTRTGRDIYAVGSNPYAARFAGIPITRTIFLVYLISGILCGLAGVLWASRFESAQTNTALGFHLQTIAAPVVGGVNIFGGSGSVLGVVMGGFLLGIINNGLTLARISPFWELAAEGLLILLAVILDSAILRRLQRIKTRRAR